MFYLESIAVLFWTGQKVLTPEKQASICLYIFKAELKVLESCFKEQCAAATINLASDGIW